MDRLARRVLSRFAMSDLFSMVAPLHGALDYHQERHSVLASNIAHVDTPGYKPFDLERIDAAGFAGVFNVELTRTTEGHLAGPGQGSAPVAGRLLEDPTGGVGNDGNAVSLDREAAKIAANQLRYDTVTAIVSAQLRELQYAANDAKG